MGRLYTESVIIYQLDENSWKLILKSERFDKAGGGPERKMKREFLQKDGNYGIFFFRL